MKYIKINLLTMNTIIHFFTQTNKLRSFIYDVHQQEGGHEIWTILQMVADNLGGGGVSFFHM